MQETDKVLTGGAVLLLPNEDDMLLGALSRSLRS